MNRGLIAIVILMAVLFSGLVSAPSALAYSSKLEREPTVVQRIIKVEGTVEKPRVLFIVPRSRLWRGGFLNKSFKDDILSPVYPEKLIKQWARPLHKGG